MVHSGVKATDYIDLSTYVNVPRELVDVIVKGEKMQEKSIKEIFLFDAIMREDAPVLQKLVNEKEGVWGLRRFKYDLTTKYNGQSLLEAALAKSEALADIVFFGELDHAPKGSSAFWRDKNEALKEAVIAQNIPMVKFLLKKRVMQNYGRYSARIANERDFFKLVMDEKYYNRDIVTAFLKNVHWRRPYSLIKAIIQNDDAEMLKCLPDFGYHFTECADIRDAVEQSDDVLNVLLDAGCRIHFGKAMNLYGKIKSPAIAERLYNMGLGVNEGVSVDGEFSPLWETKYPAIFEFLLKKKAKSDIIRDGYSIWKHALDNGPEMIQAGINGGLDVNVNILVDEVISTPLMYVDDVKSCRVLVKNGADVNMVDEVGQTAVMLTNDMDKIRFLVEEAGADLSLCDEDRNNALHFAVVEQNLEKATYFAEHGCPTQQENLVGQTPLQLARSLYANNRSYRSFIVLLEKYEKHGCSVANQRLCPFMCMAQPHMRA